MPVLAVTFSGYGRPARQPVVLKSALLRDTAKSSVYRDGPTATARSKEGRHDNRDQPNASVVAARNARDFILRFLADAEGLPVNQSVAAFDNDGTLCFEKPTYQLDRELPIMALPCANTTE